MYNRWLHWWAIFTVGVTLPLLLLGAEVTTKKVGMVDQQGFRPPWHMLTVYLQEHDLLRVRGLGFVIEHSHRLAGFLVGICIIVLAVGLWRRETRQWVRRLGAVALAGVIVQGLLGGFRVQLNALVGPNLALIHGCFAQLVFALLVSLALVTSRSWMEGGEPAPAAWEGVWLRRWSLATVGLVYLQIIFGAVVRHTESPLGPRLHLLCAFGVVAAVVGLGALALDLRPRDKHLTGTVLLLAGLVGLQVLLGVETWLAKFAVAAAEWPQLRPLLLHPELIRSVHYLVGSGLFAAAVAVALEVHRRTAWAVQLTAAPVRRLEGVA